MKYKRKSSLLNLTIVLLILILAVINVKPILRNIYQLHYTDYVEKYSKEYDLDPLFVQAVIKSESNYEVKAKSSEDAMGLMQITPSTGAWIAEKFGVKDFKEDSLYDEETNIKYGCWYLNDLYKEFSNWNLVMAAYNGGRGNVNKWLASEEYSKDGEELHNIPFNETDKYVKKVNHYLNLYKYIYRSKSLIL